MLSIGRLAPGGAEYYLDSVARGMEDYYLGAGEAPGRWMGRGSAAFGLEGEVQAEDLRAVLAGRAREGIVLVAGPGGRPRVPGFDLTFSAPKSVSLVHALGDRRARLQVVAAHEAAVAAGLSYIERHAAFVRRGHAGATRLPVEGLVAAAFRHRVSRALDPALHTHVLVANMAIGVDGRPGALDSRAIYRHARTAGYLYQAELRHQLTRRLGVEFGPLVKGAAEIADVPAAAIRAFSRRRQDIEETLRSLDMNGARAARVATLTTRPAKPSDAPDNLREEWRTRAEELGLDRAALRGLENRCLPVLLVTRATLMEELASPIGLTASASTFTRADVVRALTTLGGPERGAADLEDIADTFISSPQVRCITAGVEERFTTREILAIEQRALGSALALVDGGYGEAPPPAVRDALAGRPELGEEQTGMVWRLTCGGDGVAVVIGAAGTGKTRALEACGEAWNAGGYHVYGAALAARAAAGLEAHTGIPSTTLARLTAALTIGEVRLDARTVLVVDEAGMVGTRQLAHLIDATHRAGAKLVLVGDHRQLPEIDAGGLFAGLATRLDAVTLTDNRRQRHAWERDALRAIRDGDPATAIRAYVAAGRITTTDTPWEAREAVVADWFAARRAGADSLMITRLTRDAHDLSRTARFLLVEAGAVTGPTLDLPCGPIGVGDEVMATRNHRRIGIQNGLRGQVTAVDTQAGRITIDSGGRSVTLPRNYLQAGHLTYGYAVTAHKAQGATVDRAFVLIGDGASREWAYTALSRARDTTHIYISASDLPHEQALTPRERTPALEALTADLRRSEAKKMALDLER